MSFMMFLEKLHLPYCHNIIDPTMKTENNPTYTNNGTSLTKASKYLPNPSFITKSHQ